MWRSRKREIKVTVDYVQRESDAESESAYMRVIYCDEAHLQQTRGIQWELNRHKLFSQHFYIYSAAANCILIFTAQLYHKLIHRAMLHENGKRRKFLNKTRHAGEEEMSKVYYTKKYFYTFHCIIWAAAKKRENYCGCVLFSEKWSRFPILSMS